MILLPWKCRMRYLNLLCIDHFKEPTGLTFVDYINSLWILKYEVFALSVTCYYTENFCVNICKILRLSRKEKQKKS